MKTKPLKELLDHCDILSGDKNQTISVSSVEYDSRKVKPGSLFVAVRGYNQDGHAYINEAVEKGAAALIVEKKAPSVPVPQFQVADTRKTLPGLAAAFYSPELDRLTKIGITGTNGKTTIAYLVKSILNAASVSCGLIGTICYEIGEQKKQAWNTTPESSDLYRMMYEMQTKGQRACVMEVSSHALSLHRVAGLTFDAAVFTNLTQDHLDFHGDLETYFSEKQKLFRQLTDEGTAVVNGDDPYGQRLYEQLHHRKLTYGFGKGVQICVLEYTNSIQGISLKVKTPESNISIASSLIGKFNIENILAAIAVGCALKIDKKFIIEGVKNLGRVAGRLEPVKAGPDRIVVVDYAHTPDALEKALLVLKELAKGQLWVVFGCGGNRDTTKRPLMGAIAQRIADRIVVTSDNPRFEEPVSIINQILAGMDRTNVHIEENRREAIAYALDQSSGNDIILVAGKGHEDYQEIKGIKYPFDDKKTILELIS